MDPHIVSSLSLLLLVSCIVSIFAKLLKQPYTIALVIVGCFLAIGKFLPLIHISYDVTFTLILPPLLFHGAMHMDLEKLKRNWKSITMLAIPGVVASTFLIGFLLSKFWAIDFLPALLFGALITPTDPISVLAILKKAGAPKRLCTILEGESLFNDGTGVVVFSIILALLSGHHSYAVHEPFLKFLIVAGGGAVIGLIAGLLAFFVLKRINDHLLEVALTVALTFGTPLLAEHFHMSGIIAIVVAGLIIGNYGRVYSMSEKTRLYLENFWEVIEFIINSLLFIVIGLELQEIGIANLQGYLKPAFIAIGCLLFARVIVVYPIVAIKNFFSQDHDIPFKWAHVLFWGGLKGSISIALVVGLPISFPYRQQFLAIAFCIVLFSLIGQGLSMKFLIKKLGLSN